MIIRAALPLLLAVSFAAPLHAAAPQDDGSSLAQTSQPPRKTSVLLIYGEDSCPESDGDEIVVCAQQPESERYRVPRALREEIKEESPAMGGSWANAVEGYEDIARIGRPNSCSAVGTNGATGCTSAALRQWHAERRDRRQ